MIGSSSFPWRRVAWTASLALLLAGLGRASAAIVMVSPPSPFRGVSASATNPSTGATVFSAPLANTTFGSYTDAAVVGPMAGPLGTSAAAGFQTSATPPATVDLLTGIGTADVEATWVGPAGFSGSALTVFDVHFTVSVPGIYKLTGSVDFDSLNPTVVSGPTTNFAAVELLNTTTPSVLFSERADMVDPGPDLFSSSFLLLPSITYRLTAEANIIVSLPSTGSHDAAAGWDFILEPEPLTGAVPEPSSFVLFAGMALTASASASRRGKRKSI